MSAEAKTWRLPLSVRALADADVEAATECLRGGWYTQGPRVRAFERALEDWTGAREFAAVNSGSSALLLIAHALARRTEWTEPRCLGEVIVPALCWSTTAWPFRQMGFRVVLADVRPDTLALDLESADEARRARETVGAVLVHVMGIAADESEFRSWTRDRDLWAVADCCESLGAFLESRAHVGSECDFAAFSFYHSHTLSTLEGGAVLAAPGAEANGIRITRAHGWDRDVPGGQERIGWRFVADGFNLRTTEPQAAIGLSQMSKLDIAVAARRRIARTVLDIAEPLTWLSSPFRPHLGADVPARPRVRCAPMFLPFVLDRDAPLTRDEVRSVLHEHGIETRPLIAGNLGRHPAAKGRIVSDRVPLPVADSLMERAFMVGCPPDATDEGIEAVEKAFAAMGRA